MVDESAKRAHAMALLNNLLKTNEFGVRGSNYQHLPKNIQKMLRVMLKQIAPTRSDKEQQAHAQHPVLADGGGTSASQKLYDSRMEPFGEIPLILLRTRKAVPTTLKGDEIYAKLHGNNPKLFCTLGSSAANPSKIYEVIGRPLLYANQGGYRDFVAFNLDRALHVFRIPNMQLQVKAFNHYPPPPPSRALPFLLTPAHLCSHRTPTPS
jgi:hypothetical protein